LIGEGQGNLPKVLTYATSSTVAPEVDPIILTPIRRNSGKRKHHRSFNDLLGRPAGLAVGDD
jgi:hypothetical protein